MQIDQETLREITSSVCTSMLELTLTPGKRLEFADTPVLVGMVRVYGPTSSGLEVAVTQPLAEHIAGVMFASPADRLSDDEIFDAIGEVANMIGGSVKGLAEGETQLSLPCVDSIPGTEYDVNGRPNRIDVHFECHGEPLLVRYTEPLAATANAS